MVAYASTSYFLYNNWYRDYPRDLRAGDSWRFLTGEVAAIESLARDGFLLAIDRSPPPGAGLPGKTPPARAKPPMPVSR